jgi:hypothetical protein
MFFSEKAFCYSLAPMGGNILFCSDFFRDKKDRKDSGNPYWQKSLLFRSLLFQGFFYRFHQLGAAIVEDFFG